MYLELILFFKHFSISSCLSTSFGIKNDVIKLIINILCQCLIYIILTKFTHNIRQNLNSIVTS